jgi:hypothetical protein
MEIPGKVSVYCPLIDAKGTPATLVAVSREGFYHLEVAIKGKSFTMFVPIAASGLIFSEPEPERLADLELER